MLTSLHNLQVQALCEVMMLREPAMELRADFFDDFDDPLEELDLDEPDPLRMRTAPAAPGRRPITGTCRPPISARGVEAPVFTMMLGTPWTSRNAATRGKEIALSNCTKL